VRDILSVVAALRRHPVTAGAAIRIAAQGKLTVPALFAAALDPGISELYLAGGLVSFRNVVDSETYTHPLANFLPDFLNHTDLPEIAASLAPRKVTLAGPVDANDRAMDLDEARAIYAAAEKAGHLSVVKGARWSARTLMSGVQG
jgi:hypothetical protein